MLFLIRRRFGLALAVAWASPALPAEKWAATADSLPVPAPVVPVNVQAVYAAFTVNLLRFITWPPGTFPSADTPFVIGTFPRDPINEQLDLAVRDETVDGHPVRMLRIRSLDDLTKCQMVFLSRSYATRPAVLAKVARRPILTVSDAEGFLEMGGHVRFELQPPHVVPRISAENLGKSGLEGRAQLLRLATTP